MVLFSNYGRKLHRDVFADFFPRLRPSTACCVFPSQILNSSCWLLICSLQNDLSWESQEDDFMKSNLSHKSALWQVMTFNWCLSAHSCTQRMCQTFESLYQDKRWNTTTNLLVSFFFTVLQSNDGVTMGKSESYKALLIQSLTQNAILFFPVLRIVTYQ